MNSAAVDQLRQLATTDGPIQLQSVTERDGFTYCKVSLDTRGVAHAPGGVKVRGRELFTITVPADFPLSPPYVNVGHSRWAGTPHVQWGRHLCIYAAPSVEWDPSDGMRGLLDRLMLWLERAALGTLDPEGQPLHPPVAYSAASAGQLVVRADVGDRAPWSSDGPASRVLFAWCVQDGDRVDLLEWLEYPSVAARVISEDFTARDSKGRIHFVAVAAFISDQIAFEYPKKAKPLVAALAAAGISTNSLLEELSRARLVNSFVEGKLDDEIELPNLVVLGTPSRRIETDLLAHVSAWRFEGMGNDLADVLRSANWGVLKDRKDEILDLATRWIDAADTAWMRVWEDRPEVTRPRDGGTTLSLLRGRRVLVIGAGALGAPIAESCVRAGVSSLTVVDQSRISPGILSRQPYNDADISKAKATVLANRLSAIRTDLDVVGVFADAKDTVLARGPKLDGFDLVIDASADMGVRTAIETRRREDRQNWPDLVTVMIGHEASRGIAIAAAERASGAAIDVLRRFAIESLASPSLADVSEDLFPSTPRGDMFFPEPGCSSPTFVGSHADVGTLAGMLLNAGIELLSDAEMPMGAAVVRRDDPVLPSVEVRTWPADIVETDAGRSGFEIRITSAALEGMRAEARRGSRVRGRLIETGGMLLGAIDEASRIVFVDRVVGPPPDSRLSAAYFRHGVVGTQETVESRRMTSGNRQSFVGLWHSHPEGPARPSLTDDDGMWELVNLNGVGRRALMIIAGGPAATWRKWLKDGSTPSLFARLSELGRSTAPEVPGLTIVRALDDFPGGYAYPAQWHSDPQRTEP